MLPLARGTGYTWQSETVSLIHVISGGQVLVLKGRITSYSLWKSSTQYHIGHNSYPVTVNLAIQQYLSFFLTPLRSLLPKVIFYFSTLSLHFTCSLFPVSWPTQGKFSASPIFPKKLVYTSLFVLFKDLLD